tara:strand:+ start:309 stop:479 length:171 start_codon:yes stop_codon:yes gene_type:complete
MYMEEDHTCKHCKKKTEEWEAANCCDSCYWERLDRQIAADPYGGDDFALYNAMEAW